MLFSFFLFLLIFVLLVFPLSRAPSRRVTTSRNFRLISLRVVFHPSSNTTVTEFNDLAAFAAPQLLSPVSSDLALISEAAMASDLLIGREACRCAESAEA